MSGAVHHRVAAWALAGALVLTGTAPATGQALTERPPGLDDPWTVAPGVLQFNFVHRFEATPAPARKVLNSPTFLLAAGVVPGVMVGARYATSSLVRTGVPNEWEFFGRWQALGRAPDAPLAVGLHGGWNHAARSVDGELSVAGQVGPLRLIGAARGFSDAFHEGDARMALAGGAVLRLHEWLALAADAASMLDGDEDAAWSAGIHARLPYTPHTLSLHVSTARTTTLQGASRGGDALWGFEFTIPLTLSRYLGGASGTTGADAGTDPQGNQGAVAAEVTMTNTLRFLPDTVRIRVGERVRWRNTSDVVHTVTADREKAAEAGNVLLPAGAAPFDSGDMPPGGVFTHTFARAGTYRYVCLPHELAGMLGVVIVEEEP
ncbi:MAG: plastocyanin/azurin family copper-binding protein [Gemmatimonadota bacterium]